MLPDSPTPLVVEQMIGGVEFLDLLSFDLGRNSKLTCNDMAGLQRQGIAVDYDNEPSPENILFDVPQKEVGYNCKSKVIAYPWQSNNLHNTYAAFKTFFLWGGNEDDKVGEIFSFISC